MFTLSSLKKLTSHQFIHVHARISFKQNIRKIRDMGLEGHPLHNMLPEVKNTKYELRRKSAMKPKINTKRFMSSFINRLNFKYKLAVLFH